MAKYIVSRLLSAIVVIWGVVTAVFFLVRILPGDPALVSLGVSADPETVEALRRSMGLDKPLLVQYWIFLVDALRGNFGESIFVGQPATRLFLTKLPATIEIAISAMLLAILVAFPLGIYSARHANSALDSVAVSFTLLAQSVPHFWIGIMLVLILSQRFHLLPPFGRGTWQQMVMPIITLGLPLIAVVTRLVRTGMLDTLEEDYVRTARAKGLPEADVLYRHVIKNMLIPVVTVLGLQFASLLAGAVIVETVFAWPGVGSLTIDAILRRDYPVVAASVFFISLIFVLINLAVDLSYAYLDPRIRYS